MCRDPFGLEVGRAIFNGQLHIVLDIPPPLSAPPPPLSAARHRHPAVTSFATAQPNVLRTPSPPSAARHRHPAVTSSVTAQPNVLRTRVAARSDLRKAGERASWRRRVPRGREGAVAATVPVWPARYAGPSSNTPAPAPGKTHLEGALRRRRAPLYDLARQIATGVSGRPAAGPSASDGRRDRLRAPSGDPGLREEPSRLGAVSYNRD